MSKMNGRQSRLPAVGGLFLLAVLIFTAVLGLSKDRTSQRHDASGNDVCAPNAKRGPDEVVAENKPHAVQTENPGPSVGRPDAIPAQAGNQTEDDDDAGSDGDSHEPKKKDERYSLGNQPDWEAVKQWPIRAPRKFTSPEYTSSLEDKWRVVDTTPAAGERRTGPNPAMGAREDALRGVRGRVFEIVGAERIPLAGVMVHDWAQNRTFTDDDGRFELRAYWTEPGKDEKSKGQEYSVDLTAIAYGYIDLSVTRSYTNQDEGEDGFALYMARRDSMRVTVRFENPQAASSVTLILGYERHTAIDWDERRYIVAQIDPTKEVWFTFPQAFEYLSDGIFRLISASAPNVLTDIASLKPLSRTDDEVVYAVKLIVEDTITMTGTAVDMQTDEPVPHAVVSGPGYTEFAVASESGAFEIVLSKTPRGIDGEPIFDTRCVTVAHEAYASLRAQMDDTNLAADQTGGVLLGPGGNLTGPWRFQLRRWVTATVNCEFLSLAQRDGAKVSIGYDLIGAITADRAARPIDANGKAEFPRIPWGTRTLRLRSPDGFSTLKVPADAWNGAGPYVLIPDPND